MRSFGSLKGIEDKNTNTKISELYNVEQWSETLWVNVVWARHEQVVRRTCFWEGFHKFLYFTLWLMAYGLLPLEAIRTVVQFLAIQEEEIGRQS